MNATLIFQILAGLALVFALIAFGAKLVSFGRLARPNDRSLLKGNPSKGVTYAFTWGMMPWAKESTRLHWVAYLRGVAFHLGIFLGLVIFILSPWILQVPSTLLYLLALLMGLGAIFGFAGIVMRLVEPLLKKVSTPDDFFAVIIVSSWQLITALWLVMPSLSTVYYLVSGLMLVYAPFGKIRHCIYYAYSRLFFGKFFGRRGVLPHENQAAR